MLFLAVVLTAHWSLWLELLHAGANPALSPSTLASVSVRSEPRRVCQANTMGKLRDSEAEWELESPSVWLYQHYLPVPKISSRSPADGSSITAGQPGKDCWKPTFPHCWSVSTRICVRSSGIRAGTINIFTAELKERPLGKMINRKREGYQSASPQHSLMHTFPGLNSVTLARENQSRLSWNSEGMLISLCLFNQNTPLLQFRRWSGLQNCQYIHLIHCDIGIPPKGSSVNTDAQNKGKKAALRQSSVIYQQIVPMEIFIRQWKGISASLEKDIRWGSGSAPLNPGDTELLGGCLKGAQYSSKIIPPLTLEYQWHVSLSFKLNKVLSSVKWLLDTKVFAHLTIFW